jgi:hypothetical protein
VQDRDYADQASEGIKMVLARGPGNDLLGGDGAFATATFSQVRTYFTAQTD